VEGRDCYRAVMPNPFETPLSQALHYAARHLDPSNKASVAATASLSTLRERLVAPLNRTSLDPSFVVDELVAAVEGGILGSAGDRFFGWVIGGSLPAALAADWLTSAWDQNAALYACAPAAAVVEEVAGEWLKDLLGLPSSASFALVTGCQMAHVTCLAAARHALLAKAGCDVERDGLAGCPRIRILSSTEKHGSIVRAVRLLGLGENNIISFPADEDGRLSAETLAAVLNEEPEQATIVVLQAGDLNIGAFDDFAALIPIAKDQGAWVHIDGAFGLWAAASPKYARLLKGADAADSWATDGHKWLNVPYDCGYAFVANCAAHTAALSHRAAYLTHDQDARDQIDWTPEWSRRGRGFATYAALRQLGREGVASLVARSCEHALAIVQRIGAHAGAEIVWVPTINQGLLRFLDPRPGASEMDHDLFTDMVIAAIDESGMAFFTGTTWRGRRAMRVSVCNWQTTPQTVNLVCEGVATVLDTLRSRTARADR
jgi:glutamate/tyrosine decarboxylase-like PLP-dependent enzyme